MDVKAGKIDERYFTGGNVSKTTLYDMGRIHAVD